MYFLNVINRFATKADFGAELNNNFFFHLCSYETTHLKKKYRMYFAALVIFKLLIFKLGKYGNQYHFFCIKMSKQR